MKILIPSYDFKPMLGGVANYVHEVATLLSKDHGAQVTVVGRNMPGAEDFDSTAPYKVERIPSAKTAIASQASYIVKNLLETSRFDRILCPLWFPDATSVWWAQRFNLTSVPTYITVHASELFDVQNSLKTNVRHLLVSPLQKPVFQMAKGIFAVSSYTGKCVHEKLHVPKEKIHVINNGVNLKLFSPPATKTNNTVFQILTVTRLFAYKGIDVVLKGLAQLKEKHVAFHYTIVGSGPDKERLEKLVQSLQLTNEVTFAGALDREAVLSKYQNSDLFVMLSRYDHPDVEGFGLVFLEAAACGLPSIGGNSGGIPDALDHGATGWLVDPLDHTVLAEKINHLVKSPADLCSMSEAALRAVQSKDWSHTVQKMWQVIS